MLKSKHIKEAPKDKHILSVTRIIVVFAFAIFFGALLYVIINEFFTNQ